MALLAFTGALGSRKLEIRGFLDARVGGRTDLALHQVKLQLSEPCSLCSRALVVFRVEWVRRKGRGVEG